MEMSLFMSKYMCYWRSSFQRFVSTGR